MELRDNCPVEATLDLIGGKYKALILWHLSEKILRFSELRNRIPKATATVHPGQPVRREQTCPGTSQPGS